jgi:general stress protein 26
MNQKEKTKLAIQNLLNEQKLAVLSTQTQDGKPYASLIAFIANPDLKQLLFATSRNTRKFANLSANKNVALLVHSSSNRESDFHEAAAVTITGVAEIMDNHLRERLIPMYLEKHPYLEGFVKSPSCSVISVRTESFYLVENFQQVTELHIS